MNDKHNRDHATMLDGLYWWGVPTLFRCPHILDPNNCDIALVGVPHSTGNGTTERDQHLGPRAVRDVSALNRRAHMKFGIVPWDMCRINDLGDVPLHEANDNEKCIERITDYYRKIDDAGVRPVSVGGDHAITGGILQAIGGAQSKLTGGRKAVLLHFDAHTDAYHNLDHFLGAKKSAAHWASYLVRDGHVDPTKSVQIGIRGNPRTLDWLEPSYELGYEVITKENYDDYGVEKCIEIINDRVGDEPLYITFDLDCLDPTVAPAVANIEPAFEGFKISDVMKLLHGVRGKNVIGGDVVCLMPTKDSSNKITSLVAAAIMFEIICLVADKMKA
ncbi:MAG: arginase family protein [Gammaproteobacteria bacterium]|nr:arginase family protein [Gammaproteobacteria bacterium]MDH3467318.1 arginase family protein [Gammaproteobacteria bacterium]